MLQQAAVPGVEHDDDAAEEVGPEDLGRLHQHLQLLDRADARAHEEVYVRGGGPPRRPQCPLKAVLQCVLY